MIGDGRFYRKLLGDDPRVADAKKRMLEAVWDRFRKTFPGYADRERLVLISVPNSVPGSGACPSLLSGGVGSNFTITVAKRFLNNIANAA